MRTLLKDAYLYEEGQSANGFFYVLDGRVEQLFKRDGEFKMSRTVDRNEFFAFRKTGQEDVRADFAKIASESATLIEFNNRLHSDL